MPSIILSDNGVSSGSAGIKTTGGNDGVLALQTTTSGGTATTAVTIDTSQNVGIGTASPAQRLDVKGSENAVQARFGNIAGRGLTIGTAVVSGTNEAGAVLDAPVTGGTLIFQTQSTERARIDTSGNLLVGATGTVNNERLRVDANVASFGTRLFNSNASPSGVTVGFIGAAPNGTGNPFISCGDTATDRFIARSNGGLANYSGNDVNLSDRREKTNFAPAKSYLETICAIPVQTFNYVDQNHEEDPGLTLGVVAQDVQEVAPELVMESNWAKEGDEPKMRLSIYQTDLQYALMKSIQEQQALITTLTERISALENK